MRIDAISVGHKSPDDLHEIIEVPTGDEPTDYEIDKAPGALFLDRLC